MALESGTRLGVYEIVDLLGAGGMGEVYRARDSKLNREVAIKVLLAAVANDPDRLARFSREAQVLASLNHPNIAHIHGLEDANGVRALVMELVEGPTLANRIALGAIPLDEALPIARQIAEALEAAHEQGIVHRDLKPANIKVRSDGTVKVLDFGLAKALDPVASSSVDAANSPTLSMQATAAGVILGTAAYMSPEQARGRVVDKRADIWAFGCVLFEMLTGKRAFQGDEVTDTIVAVVSKEPDWTALPASALGARPLLARCLKKEQKQRLQAMGDARIQIEELINGTGVESGPTRAPVAGLRRRVLEAIALAGVAAAAAFVAWGLTRPAPQTPARAARFGITLPAAQPLALSFNARDLVLSPDGAELVYTAGAERQLMVRDLDRLEARAVAGISNARAPFLSPDGRWIGYFDQRGDMKKVSIDGGSQITVGPVTGTSRGAAWGPDDTIVFGTSDPATGLLRMPAAGGTPTVLTRPDPAKGERDHFFPSLLPGNRGVLFTIAGSELLFTIAGSEPAVAVFDPATGQHKTLIRPGAQAEYVETGHLIYLVGNTLWAVRFDLATLSVIGDSTPVLEQVMTIGGGGGQFSVARNGTLVYSPRRGNLARSLVWVGRSNSERALAMPARLYQQPRLSPDGTRVAVTIAEQDNNNIFMVDLARGTLTRFTFTGSSNSYPVWAPQGKSIVFASLREGVQNLYRRASDGTGAEERLTSGSKDQRPTSISPDGARLMFEENTPKTAWDLEGLTLDGKSQSAALVQTPFDERNPEISPDGRWLAYESNESGQAQVYVRPFPRVGDGIYQVSTEGGRTPAWAPTGRELFFVNGASLLSVSVQPAATFIHGNPTRLFEDRSLLLDTRVAAAEGGAYRMYDVAPDGQQFLMVKEASVDQSAKPASMVVVLNWLEELKTKMSPR